MALVIKFLAHELPLQHDLRTIWEGEVIKEARAAGCPIKSEFLQRCEAKSLPGRSDGWFGVVEADLDEFE